MIYPVKWFHNGMAGAPALTGTAGSLIALLDACLINGFNLVTLTSIDIADGVATANKNSHGFVKDQILTLAGATVTGDNPGALNGEIRVLSATTNAFTFDATGIANQTASGTITAKVAPVGGWEKLFSGTNTAAYRSTDPASSKPVLRVDDSNANYARVRGYESMTDIDTGIGPFPADAQQSGGFYWMKSNVAGATARNWTLVADSRAVHIVAQADGTQFANGSFQEPVSYKAGDAFHGCLTGHESNNYNLGSALVQRQGNTNGNSSWYTPRSHTQVGTAVQLVQHSMVCRGDSSLSGHGTGQIPYPNGPDNGFIVNPLYLFEVVQKCFRGRTAGVYSCLQDLPLAHLDKVENVDGLQGRTLLVCRVEGYGGVQGRIAFDITGPWR